MTQWNDLQIIQFELALIIGALVGIALALGYMNRSGQ